MEINMSRRKVRAAVPGGTAEAAGLTDQQERFAQEYVACGCVGAVAARAAGYAPGSASQTASALLAIPKIAARVAELQAETSARLGVTRDRLISELAAVAFAQLGNVVDIGPDSIKPRPWAEVPAAERAALVEASQTVSAAGGSMRVKLGDKTSALLALARVLGYVSDKAEVSVWVRELDAMSEAELLQRTEELRARRLAASAVVPALPASVASLPCSAERSEE